MISETTKKKKRKAEHSVTFRESAAKAFEHVLRTAARKNQEIAVTIEGRNLLIDAKKLRDILAHHHSEESIEKEILQYAHRS